MNLVVSLLVGAKDIRVIEALSVMLPDDGRPVFADDVKPEWSDVYLAIELLRTPDTLIRYGNHLFVEWFETDYSAATYCRTLERAGASVTLSFMSGDEATSDENEDYYFIRVGDELKPLNAQNIATLLPQSGLQWNEDAKQNVQQLVTYLVANP